MDLGCGSGALAMMAARAGAESAVAVDAHEGLCALARKNVALNALGRRVSGVASLVGGEWNHWGGVRVSGTGRPVGKWMVCKLLFYLPPSIR